MTNHPLFPTRFTIPLNDASITYAPNKTIIEKEIKVTASYIPETYFKKQLSNFLTEYGSGLKRLIKVYEKAIASK